MTLGARVFCRGGKRRGTCKGKRDVFARREPSDSSQGRRKEEGEGEVVHLPAEVKEQREKKFSSGGKPVLYRSTEGRGKGDLPLNG